MSIIFLVFLIPAIYVASRTLWPLALPLWSKVVVALLLLVISQYHLWSRLSSGSVFAPEFPRPVVILFNWAFGALVLLWLVQIVLDLGLLTTAAVRWQSVGLPDAARYGAIGLASVASAIAVANAVRVPPIRDVAVEVAGLPPQFEGYRILQLTDLHISKLFPGAWASAVVARANAAGSDVIVVTGDFIDGSVDMRRKDVEPLRALRAPDGIWAIPGNHEYFFDYAAWMRHLTALGFRMLPNAHMVIRRGSAELVVAGVTDLSAPSVSEAGPDLGLALRGAPTDAPIVLLDHQPRQAPDAAARGVSLQLSGHTHGGMMMGLDRLVARANGGFVAGRYRVGDMTLYVSNGTGLWPGFALRLGVPSEMTRFTLRAKP
ncbi:metallophosphoesterase [Sphingomonas sp. Leaf24]|uniref:metallophosphoesterase n=1 Tax=unclassified Sphingomonas TaxID=196159 RepID=UPI0006FC5251|nr:MULTISPECIES: metallophosphoesterase [unclassified Sphingomonas]KQM13262.1 metallophosphoesterase [Sphingomonas sp. Leaf5]KQM85848.1 metallophosphoesterase [Sphingomonas sp. Leaf24]